MEDKTIDRPVIPWRTSSLYLSSPHDGDLVTTRVIQVGNNPFPFKKNDTYLAIIRWKQDGVRYQFANAVFRVNRQGRTLCTRDLWMHDLIPSYRRPIAVEIAFLSKL